jgi:hypothetical protein
MCNFYKCCLSYLGLHSIPAKLLHWLVIAALSNCERSHRCSAARFNEKPIKPPFFLHHSLLSVLSFGRMQLQRNHDDFDAEWQNFLTYQVEFLLIKVNGISCMHIYQNKRADKKVECSFMVCLQTIYLQATSTEKAGSCAVRLCRQTDNDKK